MHRAAARSWIGAIQTLSTPARGASQESQRPSGSIFAWARLGSPNRRRRGMSMERSPVTKPERQLLERYDRPFDPRQPRLVIRGLAEECNILMSPTLIAELATADQVAPSARS